MFSDGDFREILEPINAPDIWKEEAVDTFAFCAAINEFMICVEISKYDNSYFSAYLYDRVTTISNNSAVRIPVILASELAGEYAFSELRDATEEKMKIKILRHAVEIIIENLRADPNYFEKLRLVNLGYAIGSMHG